MQCVLVVNFLLRPESTWQRLLLCGYIQFLFLLQWSSSFFLFMLFVNGVVEEEEERRTKESFLCKRGEVFRYKVSGDMNR